MFNCDPRLIDPVSTDGRYSTTADAGTVSDGYSRAVEFRQARRFWRIITYFEKNGYGRIQIPVTLTDYKMFLIKHKMDAEKPTYQQEE